MPHLDPADRGRSAATTAPAPPARRPRSCHRPARAASTNSSTAAAANPPMPRSLNSPSAGITARSLWLSHTRSDANSREYLSRQASSAARSVTVNEPIRASRNTVRSLSGIRSRFMSRSAMSRLLFTSRFSVLNRQRPTRGASTVTGVLRIRLVDVDDQHVAGIGLDVVVVGDLRRARVPDATGAAHVGQRMLVAERHVVDCAAGQRILHAGQPDQRGLGGVGVEHVDAAVRDEHPGDPVGRQTLEHLGDQVGGRSLWIATAPRRSADRAGPRGHRPGRAPGRWPGTRR